MVINELKDSIIFLDTAPLIYFIEGHSEFQNKLERLFKLNDEKYFKFVTSAITLIEILVKPLKEGNSKVVEEYKNIITNAEGIDIFDITTPISIMAAEIRAKYNIRTPDAIQIATAIVLNSDYFFTNDIRLKNISEIKVFTLQDLI